MVVRVQGLRLIASWALLIWGACMLAIMINYAIVWFPDAPNPRLNEMGIGFAIGAFYGWPTWFFLPVLALIDRKTAPVWRTVLFCCPSVIATSMYCAAQYLAR